MKRRDLLKASAFGVGLSLAAPVSFAREKILRRTPTDYEGPFYPVDPYQVSDGNLLAHMKKPRGDLLSFKGHVKNEFGEALSDTIVDIWHTDPLGRYKHPSDGRRGDRFEDFAYFGKTTTNAEGAYVFQTYVPGHYGFRPEHIHFKVWRGDEAILTSQVYFRDLGGAQGASRYRGLEDRQLVDLKDDGSGRFISEFEIVV